MTGEPIKRVEKWEIGRLRPHPKQAELFPDPPEHEAKELAADLKQNGLLQPVEALADGTLVCGHKRTAAARLLAWTHIDVWVRGDLEEKGPAAVEARLVEDNLFRRQLGPLEIARCYQRLRQLERGGRSAFPDYGRGDLRDRIGRALGVSGRTLD